MNESAICITNVGIFVGTLPDDSKASTGAACSEIYHFESNFFNYVY